MKNLKIVLDSIVLDFVWFDINTNAKDFKLNQSNKINTKNQGFWIADIPVTNILWKNVMGKFFKPIDDSKINHPVHGLSWNLALKFCSEITLILKEKKQINDNQYLDIPTEQQWELACRANSKSNWFFGDDENKLINYAWYKINSNDQSHPVRQKAPNPLGLYDLYGNVSEWCYMDGSCPNENLNDKFRSDSEICIAKGGSFLDTAELCNSNNKRFILSDNPFSEEIGLRLVINTLKLNNS